VPFMARFGAPDQADLIVRIENDLRSDHSSEQEVVASGLPTNLSAADSRRSLKSEFADWRPVCSGWQKSDIDLQAPFASDPALAIVLPTFDATH
jgi:hypothetical protein